jgi:hypothetical protein
MELNHRVTCLGSEGGWKHAAAPAVFRAGVYADPKVPVAVTAKNPLAAMWSMFTYFERRRFSNAECGATWGEFLEQRLVVFDAKQHGMPRYRFSSPVEYWNHVYYSWVSLPAESRIVVRYEDLLVTPVAEAGRVADAFGFERTSNEFLTPERVVHRMTDTWERLGPDDYQETEPFTARDYYLEEDFVHHYTLDQAERVVAGLDAELIGDLGYGNALDRSLERLRVARALS